jgi:hypothetical protein
MPHLPFPSAQCLSLDALSQRERRSRFSVGLGCPSFGGQRAGRGNYSLLLAGLVTFRRSSPLANDPRNQTVSTFQRRQHGTSLCRFTFSALGRRQWEKQHCSGWPNLEHQMPEVSTRRRHASGPSSQSSSAVAASRSGHPLAQPGSPNHSVKGTCLRQAPYVER